MAFVVAGLTAPLAVFAAVTTLQTILRTVLDLVQQASPIVAALALLAFFWGLAMYLFNFTGKDEDKKKARDLMVYGVLGIFMVVSILGIVVMLQNTFNLDGKATVNPPVIDNPYKP